MITVHHLNNSRSQRVLWLLEELGVLYEVKRYERDKTTMQAPKELKAIHPLGKSPVISDGNHTIAETGAIIEYVLEKYGRGKLIPPPGSDDRLRYTYWLHYAEGSAMTPLLLKLVFTRLPMNVPGLLRGLVKSISNKANERLVDPQVRTHLDYWDNELSKSEWFAGNEFTAADIMMSFPLEAAAARADAKSRPMVKAFLDRIHARPAYQAALKKGGPYDYAN
ncbi:MAG TPA: glutathione S-transferase [Hyphomonadaceae bacterium]|jgi:glutathione S-transferase|nr:glutathione S-transferase [Hyphomonadaceae bacterium]HPN07334.1 glutathione S-transferase [Hyphomonadaceae bacterium]